MSKIVKENSFDGAPGGSAGSVGTAAGYGTYASPVVSQNNNAFATNTTTNYNKPISDPTQTTGSMDGDLNKLFNKKVTPTPDEVMSGMQYELGKMIKKDKRIAKASVIQNLKKDPKYYSSLGMLNINDKDMDVSETKKVLDEMLEQNSKKREPMNSAILDILKEKTEEKKNRRYWKKD